jgi:hypothetical protein
MIVSKVLMSSLWVIGPRFFSNIFVSGLTNFDGI